MTESASSLSSIYLSISVSNVFSTAFVSSIIPPFLKITDIFSLPQSKSLETGMKVKLLFIADVLRIKKDGLKDLSFGS